MRGDLVLSATGSAYGGKPRPAVIIQADAYRGTASLVLCLLTSNEVETTPTLRLPVMPGPDNGLTKPSWIMVDKIVTAPKTKIARRIGRLHDSLIDRLDRSLLIFLGFSRTRA